MAPAHEPLSGTEQPEALALYESHGWHADGGEKTDDKDTHDT